LASFFLLLQEVAEFIHKNAKISFDLPDLSEFEDMEVDLSEFEESTDEEGENWGEEDGIDWGEEEEEGEEEADDDVDIGGDMLKDILGEDHDISFDSEHDEL
jgi:hypothetical protein